MNRQLIANRRARVKQLYSEGKTYQEIVDTVTAEGMPIKLHSVYSDIFNDQLSLAEKRARAVRGGSKRGENKLFKKLEALVRALFTTEEQVQAFAERLKKSA